MTRKDNGSQAPILLLVLVSVLGELGTQLYVPAFSRIGIDLAATPQQIQGTLSIFLLGVAVGQLLLGPASDHYGRRPILIGGLALYGVASAAIAIVSSVETMYLLRFAQAVGACSGLVVGRAIVRDTHAPQDLPKALSLLMLALALTASVSPAIGGRIVDGHSWRLLFAFQSLVGLAAAAMALFALRETNTHRRPGRLAIYQLALGYVGLLKDIEFIRLSLTVALVYGAMLAYVAGAPFSIAGTFGLGAKDMGSIFAWILSGFVGGIILARVFSARFNASQVASCGVGIVLMFGIALPAGVLIAGIHLGTAVAPQVFLALGAGLLLPNIFALAIGRFGPLAGTAAAMIGFLQMSAGAAAALLVSQFDQRSPLALLEIQTGCSIGAAAMFFLLTAKTIPEVVAGTR